MFKTIWQLLSYLKNYKKIFITGVLLLLAASGLELVAPIIAKASIDQVMAPAFQTGIVNLKILSLLLGAYFLLNLFGALFRYVSILSLRKMSNKIVKEMRDELFIHLHQLPISYFDQIPAGKIVSRITNDTEVLRSSFYVSVVSTLLANCIQIIGVFIAIFLLNVKLGLFLFLIFPILYLWQTYYTKYASRYNIILRETIAEISGQINEFLQGMTIIQAFQQEQRLLKEFKKTVKKWFTTGRKALLLDSVLAWGLGDFLRNFTVFLVVFFLSRNFLNGKMLLSAGLLYAFIEYINRLFDPITGLIQTVANVQQSLAAGERIMAFKNEKIEDQTGNTFEMTSGAVSFENVDFGYLKDQQVLHDITFKARPGETVALVGPTGSGKSSILNLLFRFYDPDGGKIVIDGQVIEECNRHSLREKMAIVMQDPYLFTGTIASNIGMNDPSISEEMILHALEQVGGDYLLDRYKDGLQHPVVEKGNEFSSGERQLISFARALVFNPKILILDEATSHVDTETETIIQKALEVLKKGRTTFIIAHRLSTIKDAQQILVLKQGKIVERGNHQSLLAEKGIYQEMYHMQAQQL